MSVIWEVNVQLRAASHTSDSEYSRIQGSVLRLYDTEEAAQAAYVDAVKQLGREQ